MKPLPERPPRHGRRIAAVIASLAIALTSLSLSVSPNHGRTLPEDGGESASAGAPSPPSGPGRVPAATTRPVLAVTVTSLAQASWPVVVQGDGRIEPWQEARIGTQISGLALVDLRADVGDRVRRGQLLARLDAGLLEAELAHSQAQEAEARAVLDEAVARAGRVRALRPTGAMSTQDVEQVLTAEQVAQARLAAARASRRTLELRLQRTRIDAPDDGVISVRAATVGAVLPAGQELFRLIVDDRLEWRAAVAATALADLRPGQMARIEPVGSPPLVGRVRMVGPVIDSRTGNGLVYVDLAASAAARAGSFARGRIEISNAAAWTLPEAAVQWRDGHRSVLRVGDDARVSDTRVRTGRRQGGLIEILAGLTPTDQVVVAGAGFLNDGDRVRISTGAAAP